MASKWDKMNAKRKSDLDKGAFLKVVIIPCALVFIATAIFSIWKLNNRQSVHTNIDYIQSWMTNTGKINDYQNKIGAQSAKDMKWYETKDGLEIHVGRIVLDWTWDEFLTEETQLEILRIGLTAKKDKKTGEVHIYWSGDEVEKCVQSGIFYHK